MSDNSVLELSPSYDIHSRRAAVSADDNWVGWRVHVHLMKVRDK